MTLQRFLVPLALLATHAVLAADESLRPLLQREKWQFEDPAAWEWQGSGGATALVLKKPSQFKPKVRRPFNLAWFRGVELESFTLNCKARLDVFEQGNNDVCIAFAGRGESEFYYAHLGETADGVHLHLHMVNNADRKAITTHRAKTVPWKQEQWHRIKLVRDASSGSIKLWFEDELVLEASDTTFAKGRIGLGSFDDLGSFRNVVINSPAAAPSAPIK